MADLKVRFITEDSSSAFYVDDDMVMGLSYRADPFGGDAFKLGTTVCQQATLQIKSTAFDNVLHPDEYYTVELAEGNLPYPTIFATLQIDDINWENEKYIEIKLVDKMVNLNVPYDWSAVDPQTVGNIINHMTTDLLGYTPDTNTSIWTEISSPYLTNLAVTWDSGTNARDFISYVAEVNGGYAYIDKQGHIKIKRYNNTSSATVLLNTCKDFKLGNEHIIDRVVYEYGVATAKYPDDSTYTGTGNTVYINPNNILFTDSQTYTRDAIVQQIYSYVNGLSFYNVKTTRCYIPSTVRAGDRIIIGAYRTIANVDWKYNGMWYGGFQLEVQNKKQEETQVIGNTERINQINIKVDRELNTITQTVSSLGSDVSDLSTNLSTNYYTKTETEQTASSITMTALGGYYTKSETDNVAQAEAQAQISLLVDNSDNRITSYINANADEIRLVASTLIFGDYPSGAYVEMITGTYDPATGSGFNGIKLEGHAGNNRGAITWINSAYFRYTGDHSELSMYDDYFRVYGYSDIAVTSSTTTDVYHNVNTETYWDTTDPSSPIRWVDWSIWQSEGSPLTHNSGQPYITFTTRNELIVGTPTITQALTISKADLLGATLSGATLKGNIVATNQVKTSFNNSIAMGSYQASATTIPSLVDEVRYSSGVMGSANITTAYTNSDINIPTGWYNFIYSPHRSGGVNGTASGDNCNYGTLLLSSMTADSGLFRIRVSSGSIASARRIPLVTNAEEQDYVIEKGTSGSWAYRKWASGKTEAWRTATVTASTTTQAGSIYRSSGTVDLPSGLFSSAPHLVATMDTTGTNLFQAQATASSATNINVRVWRVNASTSTYTVDVSLYAWRG